MGYKLLKFFSNSCVPCKRLTTEIQKLDLPEIDVENYDIWDDNTLEKQKEFNVKTVPTVIFFDDQEGILGSFSGFKSSEDIVTWMSDLVNKN